MKLHPCYSCGSTKVGIRYRNVTNDDVEYWIECENCRSVSYTSCDTDSAIETWNQLCELRNQSLKPTIQEPTTVYVVLDIVPAVFSTREKARERVYELRPKLFDPLNGQSQKTELADTVIYETKLQ